MGVDIAITASMLYFLVFKPKQHSGKAATSSPIKKLLTMAYQTNATSAVCQICIVALYASYPVRLIPSFLPHIVMPDIHLSPFSLFARPPTPPNAPSHDPLPLKDLIVLHVLRLHGVRRLRPYPHSGCC
jgi:hypothetical protein